eukprot:15457560-Alexandrium_andersonii.AAC.1
MPTAALLSASAVARASGGCAIWQWVSCGFRNESDPGTSNSSNGRAQTTPPTCLPRPRTATSL